MLARWFDLNCIIGWFKENHSPAWLLIQNVIIAICSNLLVGKINWFVFDEIYKIGNFNELLFRSRLWVAGPSILLGQTWALNDSITIGPFSLHRPLSFYLLIAGSCKNGRRSILLRFPFRPPQLLNCSCLHSPGYSTVHVCIMQFSMCPNSSMLCKFIINFQIGAKQSPGPWHYCYWTRYMGVAWGICYMGVHLVYGLCIVRGGWAPTGCTRIEMWQPLPNTLCWHSMLYSTWINRIQIK